MRKERGRGREEGGGIHVVVFKMGTKDGAAKFADTGNHKTGGRVSGPCGAYYSSAAHLVPRSVQEMYCVDLGSLIILGEKVQGPASQGASRDALVELCNKVIRSARFA